MCSLSHRPRRRCRRATAGRNAASHRRIRTYMGASCIWRPSALSSHPRAAWTICKWVDARHRPSYPDPLSGFTLCHTHTDLRVSLRSKVGPAGFCRRGIYEYLQFGATQKHRAMLEGGQRVKWWLVSKIYTIYFQKMIFFAFLTKNCFIFPNYIKLFSIYLP